MNDFLLLLLRQSSTKPSLPRSSHAQRAPVLSAWHVLLPMRLQSIVRHCPLTHISSALPAQRSDAPAAQAGASGTQVELPPLSVAQWLWNWPQSTREKMPK
jgi:hypothetical protein